MALQFTSEHILKGYYYLALFATILFALKLVIFSIVGAGDSEVASDFNSSADSDPSFNFISMQSIMAFLMGFGWMGFAGLKQLGLGQGINLAVAFAVGFMFMFLMSFLMFSVKKLEKNVKNDKSGAVQSVGRAYTGFEPFGFGQVEIEINGKLSVVKASNMTDENISAFELIRVVKVEDDILYIEKVKK